MTDLHWLAATLTMTAIFWLPYVLNLITKRGLASALANPSDDGPKLSEWAIRAKAAHYNAVENLVLFAPLILIAHALGMSGAMTLLMAKLYFFARLAHYIIYTAGIPVARTLVFATGWAATIGVGLVIFGIIG